MIRRRDFITLLGGAAAAWPFAARAQQRRTGPVIGMLGGGRSEVYAARVAAFKQALKEAGFVEGQNVTLEFRWANDEYEQLPSLAAELVHAHVALIAAIGNNLVARATKRETTTIPIVFANGADPVAAGLVPSLNRPSGNITGVTTISGEVVPKRLQLLHDLVPNIKMFGCLVNPDNPAGIRAFLELAQNTVHALGGGTIHVGLARTVGDFDAAVASVVQKGAAALFLTPDALFNSAQRLIALAAQHRTPMIFNSTEATRAGGLMSYSASFTDAYRQAGLYAARILKGEKPADLPVLQPTKFEFVFNRQTARTLGIEVPPTLLAIADEVIE
jgi:putative tryptophan/tyrosine transport system substrate-binding protein